MRDAILPDSWRLVRLHDVTDDIRYGVNETNDLNGKGAKFLRISDVNDDGELTSKSPVRLNRESVDVDRYRLQFGDLLLARSGSVGRSFVVPYDFADWVFASYFIRFRLRQALVDPVFVGFFCRSPLFRNQVARIARVVAQPNVNSSEFAGMLFPLPPLTEQRRIVKILQEAEEIRRLRTKAETKATELIPAIFHKMFLSSAKHSTWKNTTVADVAIEKINAIRTGPFGSDLLHSEFVDSGIPVLGIDNAVANRFRWSERRYITPGKYADLGRFRVYPGDVMITIMGTVGRVAIAPSDLPESISTKHLCVITPNKDKILPTFLWATLLYNPSVKSQTQSAGKGAIMEGWNSKIIRNLKFPLPPLNLQKEFESQVQAIFDLEEHLLTTTLGVKLNASLSAHAFSGQLTADWREANKSKLANEVRERDAALKEAGATFSHTSRTMADEIEEMLQDRTDGIYADLNREQRELLHEIERMFAGVDYGRYFTAEHVAADIKGTLHRHPQRIESHLALFAARGLIIPVSRPRDYSTGPAFAACYRLPIIEKQAISDEGNADVIDSDDIRGALMEAHRKLATGRI